MYVPTEVAKYWFYIDGEMLSICFIIPRATTKITIWNTVKITIDKLNSNTKKKKNSNNIMNEYSIVSWTKQKNEMSGKIGETQIKSGVQLMIM